MGHWIIIVHPDGTSEFYRFDDREKMWCCEASPLINMMLVWELQQLEGAAALS